MKILSISVKNFASYKQLDFDFQNQGLTLIQGANGSGKSTLCDVIPWVLFGRTAKGGLADEIKTWGGTEATVGEAILYVKNRRVTITRIRGKSNDLYYQQEDDLGQSNPPERGKDLSDTQRIINIILDMNYDLYLAGSYFHEFSQTAQFFTTAAKNRRAICEQLADLSLPVKLQSKIAEEVRLHHNSLSDLNKEVTVLYSNITLLQRLQSSENTKATQWEETKKFNREQLTKQYERFEENRDTVVHNQCAQCGTKFSEPKYVHNDAVNPYIQRISELETSVNPHTGSTQDHTVEIDKRLLESAYIEQEIAGLNQRLGDLGALNTVVHDFRSNTIQNTIKFVETRSNKLLADYFDAEIRVQFDMGEADKLEVLIFKDGNGCSYEQLSKGQRCLLKLCFGTAVMETVQNHHGLTFSQVFYDESLDGLSDMMKVKAYRLFESLNYESVFVVEHSEALKTCFGNAYTVELAAQGSILAKAT